jgi:N-acetylglucosamine-6-phosphate deacetylase
LGLVIRAKSPARTILITDAIRAAGMEDGDYDLGGQIVHVRDGIARTEAGSLAGSTLTMIKALRNAFEFGQEHAGLTLNQALQMATATPAEALGLAGRKGTIQPGADADIIVLDAGFNVQHVIVGGRLAW